MRDGVDQLAGLTARPEVSLWVRRCLASLLPLMKHLTNAEVGLRPGGAIEAYAPEGMWNAEGWVRFAQSFFIK